MSPGFTLKDLLVDPGWDIALCGQRQHKRDEIGSVRNRRPLRMAYAEPEDLFELVNE